jgi:hypothetical protein
VTRLFTVRIPTSIRKKTPQAQKPEARKTKTLSRHKMPAQRKLLLPGALLVTISLKTLAALVLVHLETALLFEVAHESEGFGFA